MDKLLLILSLVCTALASPIDNGYDFDSPEYRKTPLGGKIDKPTMKLLKELYDESDNKNVISSPVSLMMLLSIYNSGAGPVVREEITKFLGGSDYRKISDEYRELSKSFSKLNPESLSIANKVYVSNRYSLQDNFTVAARSYDSEVDTLEFSLRDVAAGIINRWADEKTKGVIKDPVDPKSLDINTAAALFNVIYFKGHWNVPFNEYETWDEDFYLNRNTVVKKQTMHLKQSLPYMEDPKLGARMIQLSYKEKGFRMVVVLPNKIDGLSSVLEKAAQKGILDDVFRLTPSKRDVRLDIPKFDIKSRMDLENVLPKIGLSELYDEPAVGIVKDSTVRLSKVFQDAFIKVDEEGSTAAAFSGMIMEMPMAPPLPRRPIIFKVDHPFLYLILHEDKILFAGTYTQ